MCQSGAENNDIIKENAELIHRAVLAISAKGYIPGLEKILEQAELNGWECLVGAIRKILKGERDLLQLAGLDEEDQAIVTAILQGIKVPSSLPDLTNTIDAVAAGVSMANMVHDAAAGDSEAIEAIRGVSQQMGGLNGDFSILSGAINLMVNGERREEILCKGMGASGISLVQTILESLKKLEG